MGNQCEVCARDYPELYARTEEHFQAKLECHDIETELNEDQYLPGKGIH